MEKERENPIEEQTKEQVEEQIEEQTKEQTEEQTEEQIEEQTKEQTEEQTEEQIEDQAAEEKEEETEKETEKPIKKFIKEHKKIVIGGIIFLCTVLGIYLGMTQYFTNHYYLGTEINGVNVSGKTVEEVKTIMASELQAYTLNLKERGDKMEQIKANDVGLKYSSDEKFREFKESQNPFKWILAYFTKENSKLTVGFSYDEKKLKERMEKLSCFDSKNIIEPKNPSFKYVDNSYEIIDEVLGNKIDKEILYSHIADSIVKREVEIDLESADCYIKPQYTSESPKTIEVKDTLNKYVSSKITYTFGDRKETLDGSIINKWLIVDENYEVTMDEEKVKDYIGALSKTYNTIGKTRSFVASSGKTIKIGGGDYGWSINKKKEIKNLITAIKEGKSIKKEPTYNQTAFSRGKNDIGNTYVEINLGKQHIWFYKNGSLITHGDIVTGNVKERMATPKGIYRLKYKARNVVLRGPGYASPVTFWMPFNGGIGMHDANWRSVFGGNIYKTNGSHGCINCPYNVAKAIFNNIKPDTPVICY